MVDTIIWKLDSKFSTKDLGPLSYFCGVKFLTTSSGLLLSQQKYVIDLLSKHNMLVSKTVSTPLVVGTSLTANDGTALINATMYRRVICCLQHLQMTWPNISFVVNKLSQFMHTTSNAIGERSNVCFIILMARDPLVYAFLQTLLKHCMVFLMQTRLVTPMIVPSQVFFLYSLVLI